MRIRVIGVGSEQGDDSAGLVVADRLRHCPLPANVDVVECPRPGLDLLDELSGADAVVVVDAMQSGRPAGTVRRIPIELLQPQRGYSSHSLGVAEALELAKALGRLPRHVEIVGIEGSIACEGALSPAVAKGVEAAAEEILALLGELQREEPRYMPPLAAEARSGG